MLLCFLQQNIFCTARLFTVEQEHDGGRNLFLRSRTKHEPVLPIYRGYTYYKEGPRLPSVVLFQFMSSNQHFKQYCLLDCNVTK